jgi:hypothetical protein
MQTKKAAKRKVQQAGRIYVLRNEHMRDLLVKVGKTIRGSEERARELTKATGVAGKFNVLFQEQVCDVHHAERLVHERLAAFRLQPNREFFQVPYELAIRTVISTCAQVNRERDISRSANIRHVRLLLGAGHDAQRLKALLAPFRRGRGRKVQVVVSYRDERGAASDVLLGNDWRVVLSPFLVADLQDWLGKDAVLFATA